MAGSYNHCIDKATGKLYRPKDLRSMLENDGDVYEAIEELYGMVWYLADALAQELSAEPGETAYSGDYDTPAGWIETAQQDYRQGLEVSPGTDGRLSEEV